MLSEKKKFFFARRRKKIFLTNRGKNRGAPKRGEKGENFLGGKPPSPGVKTKPVFSRVERPQKGNFNTQKGLPCGARPPFF